MAHGIRDLSLTELRRRFVTLGEGLPKRMEEQLRSDPRTGARAILEAVERRRRDHRAEGQRLRKLSRIESELFEAGYVHVAGIDEAGMSPLAGPVVAAAVILPRGFHLMGVDDSKKLTAEQREELAPQIRRGAIACAVGSVDPEEIDRINIYRAGLLAMRRAVQRLSVTPDYLLIDARSLKELAIAQRGIVRGDQKSISIAAASIVAKTTRDAWMVELDRCHEGYGFARHKGYPVAEHLRALSERGPCAIHRKSFRPVQQALGKLPQQAELFSWPRAR